jgi:hypothetical protein
VAGEASGAAVAEVDVIGLRSAGADDYDEPLRGMIERGECEPPDEFVIVDVDELAIDAARDYCETCGKFTDGETCVACGDES